MDSTVFNKLFIEKYRPQTLDEIILPVDTRLLIEKWIDDGIIPNIFLCSKPGQGKTSLAKLLAKNVFGVDYRYINASDENGIDSIRNNVQEFAKTKSFNGDFKIIILDEVEILSNQAQSMLRALMEEVADNARFILTANKKGSIMEALRSRCQFIDINPDKKEITKRLLYIIKNENVKYEIEELKKIPLLVNTFYPDIRSCVKELQNSIDKNGELKIKTFTVTEEFLNKILDFMAIDDFNALRKFLIENEISFNGDYVSLLQRLTQSILNNSRFAERTTRNLILILAEYIYKSSFVFDQEINSSACLIACCKTISDNK